MTDFVLDSLNLQYYVYCIHFIQSVWFYSTVFLKFHIWVLSNTVRVSLCERCCSLHRHVQYSLILTQTREKKTADKNANLRAVHQFQDVIISVLFKFPCKL